MISCSTRTKCILRDSAAELAATTLISRTKTRVFLFKHLLRFGRPETHHKSKCKSRTSHITRPGKTKTKIKITNWGQRKREGTLHPTPSPPISTKASRNKGSQSWNKESQPNGQFTPFSSCSFESPCLQQADEEALVAYTKSLRKKKDGSLRRSNKPRHRTREREKLQKKETIRQPRCALRARP
jgi:hypothetical protein